MLDRMTGHLIKSLQDGVANAGSPTLQDGSRHSASAPLSSFVYCCSICITEFGDEARMIPEALRDGVLRKSGVLRFITIPGPLRGAPDLVEEYFYLAGRFLDYCPGSLLSSPLLGHILQSASTGLRVEHREALRGVLHFCGECTAAAVLALKRVG